MRLQIKGTLLSGVYRLSNIRFWDNFKNCFCTFVVSMNKELCDKRNKVFREVLRIERKHHKISQKVLAQKLGVEQSYISKTEIGDRRLDVIELMEYCDAIGLTLTDFVFRMEGRLLAHGLLSPERKKDYLRWLAIYLEHNEKSDTQTDVGLINSSKRNEAISDDSNYMVPSGTNIKFSITDVPDSLTQ